MVPEDDRRPIVPLEVLSTLDLELDAGEGRGHQVEQSADKVVRVQALETQPRAKQAVSPGPEDGLRVVSQRGRSSGLTFPINPRKTATPSARNDVVRREPT